jgi:hypothetical protein
MIDSLIKYIDENRLHKSYFEIMEHLKHEYDTNDIKFVFLNDYNYDIELEERLTFDMRERRHYQQLLRAKTLERYREKCVITGIDRIRCLETAHIKPVTECVGISEKSDPYNCLLLWMDIHIYFDAYELSINPITFRVEIDMNNPENLWMSQFNHKYIGNLPNGTIEYLKSHYQKFFEKQRLNTTRNLK